MQVDHHQAATHHAAATRRVTQRHLHDRAGQCRRRAPQQPDVRLRTARSPLSPPTTIVDTKARATALATTATTAPRDT
jgi:hypothetical protein